jgi:hypothetical protein
MKSAGMLLVCFSAALAPAAMAQKWEFGGGVGGGFYTSQDVTAPGGSAAAKLQSNLAGGAWLANNGQGHWGGEAHFDYQMGDLLLNSQGNSASFGAHTYAMHYDALWYATRNGSRIRPFVALGGGVKVFQGTGTEVVYQPLSNFALLTKQQDLTPLVSAGGGVKIQLTSHIQFRLEVHDYLSPFPKKVIVPNQGAKVGGWLQDFVPMAGLSFTFPGREF